MRFSRRRYITLSFLPALALAMMLAHSVALAQPEPEPQKEPDGGNQPETIDDLELDPNDFKFESDLIGHYSHGWFPQAHAGYSLSLMGQFFYADVFDYARNIRPNGFHPTTAPFSSSNPFFDNEREILKANDDEEEDDGFPETDYSEYALSFLYNLPMPLILRGDLALQITDGILFSNDTTRSFLSLAGWKHSLKEVGVASLSQYTIAGSIGFDIPVYGVFLESEAARIASYYYVHAGISAGYVIVTSATQYAQIANAKDELRYGNGRDTVTFIHAQKLSDLNRLRTALDFSIGWNLASTFGVLTFEGFVSVPTSSVLNDVVWKQYYGGLRIGIGYQWEPE